MLTKQVWAELELWPDSALRPSVFLIDSRHFMTYKGPEEAAPTALFRSGGHVRLPHKVIYESCLLKCIVLAAYLGHIDLKGLSAHFP